MMPKVAENPRPMSLKTRLRLSALLLLLLLLPAIGMALHNAFERQASSGTRDELNALLYSVLTLAEVDSDGLQMPGTLAQPQFNVDKSGLYAIISGADGAVLWRSGSLVSQALPATLPRPARGERRFGELSFGEPSLGDERQFILSFSASFETRNAQGRLQDFPLTVHIIKSRAAHDKLMRDFRHSLWRYLALTAVLLAAAQGLWLLWTLKPLQHFQRELEAVENGRQQLIGDAFPRELQPLVRQLNSLLTTEQNQRTRYRNALADLAHSLKTPLAVLKSQPQLPAAALEQIDAISYSISHQLKRAQSAGAASWHQGVAIAEVTDKLLRTLGKLHADTQLQLTQSLAPDLMFKGDSGDLTELLGNLLDNACKAAKSQVRIAGIMQGNNLHLVVEDDGPGIPDDLKEKIFERGMRADTYEKGHGIGLAIVRDLVDSYQGRLNLGRSEALGGARFELVFRQ
ncbi:GHKL domain-containing protein [Shewanella cyperi]|uniref:histidine kinase n=2 Tax=Shewanella cyperi TaxID=2814292 RepID=A0A974XMK8_9GAMM|nr:GHKL domain-containing protein [Shewanella cyperi]